MAKQHLEEALHLVTLSSDPPVPPFWVICRKIKVWLVTVAKRVAKRSIGWEDVKRVPYADESLVDLVRGTSLDIERMVRLGYPYKVIIMTFSLQSHDLQRSRSVDTDR